MTDFQIEIARQIRGSLQSVKFYDEFRPILVGLVESGVRKEDLNAALLAEHSSSTSDPDIEILTCALDALIEHGWGLPHTKLYPPTTEKPID